MARDIKIRITGDSSGLKSALGDAEGRLGSFGSKVGGILGGIAKAGGLSVAGGVAAAVPLLKGAVGAASDFNETLSKSQVIFGDAQDEVEAFAKTAARGLGQSEQQALDAASTFAVFGKSAGLTGKDLAGFSKKMVGLSSDMASFSNTSPEQAIEAIGSALRGEAEPIRKYGVLLDDATLRNQALKLGLISSTKDALTPANKVLAAQAAILEQTGDAQGDFARTSEGLANKQRIVKAEFENASKELGEVFLPAAISVADFVLQKVVPALRDLSDWVKGVAATARESGWGAAFGQVVEEVAGKIGSLATRAWDFLSANLPGWLASFGEWFSGTAAPWLGERAAELGGKIAELSRVAWERLKENLPVFLQAFAQWFTETAVPWVVEKAELIASALADWVPKAWNATVEKLKEYLKKLEEWFENDASATSESGGNSMVEAFIRGLGNLWLSTQTTLAEWQGKVTYWFFTEGVPAFVAGVLELGAQATATLEAAARNLFKAGVQIGKDIIQGVIDGIWAKAGELAGAVKSVIWGGIPESVRKYMQIDSPSKVMADIGGQMAEGLAVGLLSGSRDVAFAAQSLVNSATDPAMSGFPQQPFMRDGQVVSLPGAAGSAGSGGSAGFGPRGLSEDTSSPGVGLSAVGLGGGSLTINIHGVVGEQQAVVRWISEGLRRYGIAVG